MPTGKRISLKLTPQQKEEIMKATGKKAEELEFGAEEREERIAPLKGFGRGGGRWRNPRAGLARTTPAMWPPGPLAGGFFTCGAVPAAPGRRGPGRRARSRAPAWACGARRAAARPNRRA